MAAPTSRDSTPAAKDVTASTTVVPEPKIPPVVHKLDDAAEEIEEFEMEEEERAEAAVAAAAQEAVLRERLEFRPEKFEQRTLHPIMLAIIAELLDKNLLEINEHRDDGILEFLFNYNPLQEPGDQGKFERLIAAILAELEIFRLQQRIMQDFFLLGRNPQGQINSLRINFANPGHYDRFLLLLDPLNQRQTDLLRTPFSTRLTAPFSSSSKDDDEEEEENKSLFRLPDPRDRMRRLKPVGAK